MKTSEIIAAAYQAQPKDSWPQMHVCPICGSLSFGVTAHVTQDWKIDCMGTFLEAIDECVEVTHQPDNNDIWDCYGDCFLSTDGQTFVLNDYFEILDKVMVCVKANNTAATPELLASYLQDNRIASHGAEAIDNVVGAYMILNDIA